MDDDKWKIKKEVSLGDLLAFFAAFSAVLYAYTTLDKRVALVELFSIQQKERDERQDDGVVRTRDRLEKSLSAINDKLDWIIKREVDKNGFRK